MDVVEHLLRMRALFRVERGERIEETLVVASREQPALDAQLVQHAGETETVHQYADRADQACPVDEDLVGGNGDVIAPGCAYVLDHCIQRYVRILRTQSADLVVDLARLYRTAARAVDTQHDAHRIAVLERRLQAGGDLFGRRRAVVCDHPVHLYQRGVPARRGHLARAEPPGGDEQQQEQVEKSH